MQAHTPRPGTDSVRRRNLSRLLRVVHLSNGVSRAELTAMLELNRSTIADLVAELTEADLVVEETPSERGRVGRPSPIVRPGSTPAAIAVNPEIDAITVAIVGLDGRVIRRERRGVLSIPTPAAAVEITTHLVASLLSAVGPAHRIVGMGVAVPGLVRFADGLVRLAPHLEWRDVPIASMLAEAMGMPVVAANDAHLGCLAESAFGAGRAVDHVVYLNGGASGIGGGVFASGAPLTGVDGLAGEFGHTFVRTEGSACHCGARGCLETEVRREPLLRLLGLADGNTDTLDVALAGSDNQLVLDEVHRQLGFLAIALRNSINILNPQLVILGGFLGSLYAKDPAHLESIVSTSSLSAPRASARIEVAQLGADILLIGAAELAFESTLADPASFGRHRPED